MQQQTMQWLKMAFICICALLMCPADVAGLKVALTGLDLHVRIADLQC